MSSYTEDIVQQVWRRSRYRLRPFALVESRDGTLVMQQADQPLSGTLIGVYDRPDINDLRADLMEVSHG